jgi:hypothetical protein
LSWRWYNNIPTLKGIYQFQTEHKGIPFKEEFNLEFFFPPDYPDNLPLVKEIGGKIPAAFHHFSDGSLCLCAPTEQYIVFSKNPTLENYMKNLVNPFLLGWLWYQKYNEMLWGERAHGLLGLLESYQELLNIKDKQYVLPFMYKYIRNELFSRQECPCGTKLPFRKCHRKIMHRLENHLPKELLRNDFREIFRRLKNEGYF